MRLDLAQHAREVRLQLPSGEHQALHHRQTAVPEQGLHDRLVHARGGGQDAAPNVGHPGQLQQSLDRAVLSVGAVEHGEYHVHIQPCIVLPGGGRHDLGPAGHDVHQGWFRAGECVSGLQRLHGVALEEPPAFLGYPHRHHLVPRRVQLIHDGGGRGQGDLMLPRAPPEHHRYSNAHPSFLH